MMKRTPLPAPFPFSVLRGHVAAVNTVDFVTSSSGSCKLASGDVDGRVMVWNLQSNSSLQSWKAHDSSVLTVESLSTNLFTSGRDGLIKQWDVETSREVCFYLSRCEHFCNISCSKTASSIFSSNLIASADASSKILIWDVRIPTAPIGTVEAFHEQDQSKPLGMVMSVLLPERADIVCSGHEDGSIAMHDLRSMKNLHILPRQHSQPVFSLGAHCQHDQLRYLYSGGGDDRLFRYSSTSEEATASPWTVTETETLELPQPGTSCIDVRSDGKILISSHWDHSLRVWQQKKLKCLGIFRFHKQSVFTVRFGQKETETAGIFASASKDGQIALWNLFADTYSPLT